MRRMPETYEAGGNTDRTGYEMPSDVLRQVLFVLRSGKSESLRDGTRQFEIKARSVHRFQEKGDSP